MIEGRPRWMDRAFCLGMDADIFFPETRGTDSGYDEARSICFRCPVQSDCLEYALANRINYGMWGGTSQKERIRLRKERRVA